MLKVGLLGAGRIAGVHATAIAGHDGSQLVAVSDINDEAAAALAKRSGAEARDSEAILNDPEIDAVLIATSTDTHSDLMERATAAGKAVLCEKPVDLSLDRARQCLAAVQPTGMPVMIGFNRRFDPNFASLRRALNEGQIGDPEMLSIASFDPEPPPLDYVRISGGLYRDMMIHDFDMANFMMGAMPETVSAMGSCLVNPQIGEAGDVDSAVVTMHYADGRIAVIRNSRRAAYGYDQRLEILGSKGMLMVNNVLENTVVKATDDGVSSAKPTYFFLQRYVAAFAAEWAAFADALASDTPMPVTLEDGVSALVLAEAATLSSRSGQPVRIDSLTS